MSSFLDLIGMTSGPRNHELVMKCIQSGLTAEKDVKYFLEDIFHTHLSIMKCWDRACKEEEKKRRNGTWVAVWTGNGPPRMGSFNCPQLIFGRGNIGGSKPRVVVFNSRKPRVSTGKEEWLNVLRRILPVIASMGFGFASSSGTPTYDLAAAYAERSGLPTLLVAASCLEVPEGFHADDDTEGFALVAPSCMRSGCRCPKTVQLSCRDRLLAFLADAHCIIEIRAGGNLHAVIEAQQRQDPKPQMIFMAGRRSRENKGNELLLECFPEHAKPFDENGIGGAPSLPQPAGSCAAELLELREICWEDYLYHYTRGWHGPWPGQTHREHLLDLLEGGPFCAHNTMDTLVRILSEGVLRASSRLVRGKEAVVSWTSRPPVELASIRLWNPGLIRWTFEPYGLAVKRKVLKEHGARPTIYAGGTFHKRLRPDDRYRFQKDEPPRCSWRHEREWRLRNDLKLRDIEPTEWFVFIPNRNASEVLQRYCKGVFSVVFLSETAFRTT